MLLQVTDLAVGFETENGLARAVEGVSLELEAGGSLCLVGESGCGKSVSVLALLRLLPTPPAKLLGGQALFEGRDLLSLPESELTRLRGSRIGMIFQEPMTSLNPVFKVGDQVAEPLMLHRGLSRAQARQQAVELLEMVGISQAAQRAADYPHQLSGGMRQRVMIAMATACRPALLIADEPTTALDVSVQGQILDLMRRLRQGSGSALLIITHDLEVAAASAERLAVMYAGSIVESGGTADILAAPLHPYTQGLIASRPRLPQGLDQGLAAPAEEAAFAANSNSNLQINSRQNALLQLQAARRGRLEAIPGTVPSPLERPAGCAFAGRCPQVFAPCFDQRPPLLPIARNGEKRPRFCRCWLYK